VDRNSGSTGMTLCTYDVASDRGQVKILITVATFQFTETSSIRTVVFLRVPSEARVLEEIRRPDYEPVDLN
jgi:hypothetical protein